MENTPDNFDSTRSSTPIILGALGVVVVILVGVIGFLAYSMIKEKADEKEDEKETESNEEDNDSEEEDTSEEEKSTDDSEEEEEETTSDCDPTIPSGWVKRQNTTYNYTVAMPSNWWYRFFGSMQTMGMDPNEIPEASEYAGLVTMSAYTDTVANLVADSKSSLVGSSESTITVNCKTWTKVEGQNPSGIPFYADYKVVEVYTSHNGKTFCLKYMNDPGDFNTYKATYDKILESVDLN
ncbi:hypothetical protein JW710_05130 [Candidatus Dojkabacteria bacterium]|nr:hypothetical protein [Candidatus Dojkabacteria bacterium]